MSIGEVMSLYRDEDIEVHPEFQRIFRWTDSQKSRLIESLLLGIPVPPIFVSQREDGVWDVIDGVQRLSTIFEFVGIYRDYKDATLEPLTLVSTEYLPDLDGFRWEVPGVQNKVFTDSLRRAVKRARLEFRIVQKESDANAKYDLFQRLNSGTDLSPQEARNCLLVMLNARMFEAVLDMSTLGVFENVVPLSERKENEAFRQELVLRFFCQNAFQGGPSDLPADLGEYLTTWTRRAAELFETEDDLIDPELFNRVFSLLNETVGEDAFRRFDGSRHLGSFSISAFEFISSGIAANIDFWEDQGDKLAKKIQNIWTYSQFRNNSGVGVSARRRFPRLVVPARKYFARV